MTSTVVIACQVNTNDASAGLGFEAWIDDSKFYDTDHVTESQTICMTLADTDAEHELRLIMKNKTMNHTKLDADGNMVSDARLIVSDVTFDEIKLGHMLTELATYTHDFNGNGSATQDKFYGELGCNGTVSLKFSTPVYLWLLEHM